jgi:hypothetical protein
MAQEKARDVQVDLTAEERAFLAGKQLRLGVDVARPPFEYLDEEGAYTGISAEFSRLPPSGLASQLFRRKG